MAPDPRLVHFPQVETEQEDYRQEFRDDMEDVEHHFGMVAVQ